MGTWPFSGFQDRPLAEGLPHRRRTAASATYTNEQTGKRVLLIRGPSGEWTLGASGRGVGLSMGREQAMR